MKNKEPDSLRPQLALPFALWQLAFRPGFLLAGTFAVVAMLRWLYWMEFPGSWDSPLAAHWWHAHEMVFGFALPVVAGFLLSAVATWTGIAGTTGLRLQLLFGLWLVARIVLWLFAPWLLLAWVAESLFIAFVMFELGQRVWARRQWRNMVFLPVLLFLALLNTASYATTDDITSSTQIHYGAIWMITALIVIVGGRVIPLFTANRLNLEYRPQPAWFEYSALASVLLIGLATVLWPTELSGTWMRGLCLATGALHLFRLGRWQGLKTARVPLLWSMHLSYLCIPLALLGLGLVGHNVVAIKNLVHLLAVGAIGGMVLSMMCRVSLGHTGRTVQVPQYLAVAFAALFVTALVRAIVPMLWPNLTMDAWRLSAMLWVGVFSLFLLRYLPVLIRPRIDNKPG